MNKFLTISVLCIIPAAALAQDQAEEDKGYLTELIEENLSSDGTQVSITGFAGALSSEATIEELTIADRDGVWLTLEDVSLVWSRAALLRGAIEVDELSAAKITVARAPLPSEAAPPNAEATPFSLPELPVSINLAQLSIGEVALAEVFLGEPVTLSIDGSAALAGGEGAVNITADRLDARAGRFALNGSYANETRALAIDLNLSEAADGIAARLLDLPGRPSVALSIVGAAPLSDFAAELALATDGVDRVTGTFGTRATEEGQQFALDIGGDVTPLIDPSYREFFGTDIALSAVGGQQADGGFDLQDLNLTAQTIRLSGQLSVDSDGWPETVNLKGDIGKVDGGAVLLPIAGAETFVDDVDLTFNFDAAVAPDWQTRFEIAGLRRPGLSIDTLDLTGGGLIAKNGGEVTVNLTYGARGLTLDDAGAAEALGDALEGQLQMRREPGHLITVEQLTLSGAGLDIAADAKIKTASEGFETQSNILLSATSIDRFATLIGQPISGAANLAMISTVRPLDGIFDVIVNGDTLDLATGIAQLDPLLAGAGELSAIAARDTLGTRLEALRIATPTTLMTGDADLRSDGSTANVDLEIANIAVAIPELSGPAVIAIDAMQDAAERVTFDVDATIAGARFEANGTADLASDSQTVEAQITANLPDLSRYNTLSGQNLSGAAEATINGTLRDAGATFEADLTAETRNLRIDQPEADRLLAGTGTLTTTLARRGPDDFDIANLRIAYPAISLTAKGAGGLNGALAGQARINLPRADVIAPGLPGALDIFARVDRGDELVTAASIDAKGNGTTAFLTGTIAAPDDLYRTVGKLTANVENLRPFQSLIGQPVSGGLQLTLDGTIVPDLSEVQADLSLRTDNIGIGSPIADRLLRGAGDLSGTLSVQGDTVEITGFSASTSEVNLSGALRGEGATGSGSFDARLRDIGLFTDTLNGPVTATGSAAKTANGWAIDVDAGGPGGIGVAADGTVTGTDQLDIAVRGAVPLGLANDVLAPRRITGDARFDLAINGPPAIGSVSGTIQTTGARLALPTLEQAIEDITGGVTLTTGTATIGIDANVEAGGALNISGPVRIDPPYQGDITITLRDVILRDPTLYDSSVAGAITVTGPLTGGARIAGRLALGTTEVQVPSSGIGALGTLPEVTHIGASAAVRQTLQRADADGAGNARQSANSTGPAFPLDITVDAPSRIFIRGRGLDAELGGSLNLGGTTANIIPVGQFDLVRGRLDILQQRFELAEGSASLQGDFEPYLRLVAETEVNTGTVITITVEGPASEPEVTFSSVPELPQDEVLAQLIFGRNLSEITPLQAVQLASAVATLAGRGGGGIIDSFRTELGLDDFDVTTDDDGNAALRAGKYLSDNVYTDVTVASDGSTEINLNLDITDEITAKGTAGTDGETSIGIFFERDY